MPENLPQIMCKPNGSMTTQQHTLEDSVICLTEDTPFLSLIFETSEET